MKKNRFKTFSVIAIFCLGFLVYSNTFHCSFHLDDNSGIVFNIVIKSIHHLKSIWDFWPSRLITYLSIALNYHFNGLDVRGYHLFNLAVHLGAAILVWWLTFLTLATPVMKEEKIAKHANVISLLAGLIFVAHPIQTEAVTYIVQRASSMATLFYMASLCFYVKFRLQDTKIQIIYYICSLTTAVLAMFCKEMAITLPLMILVYECCFFKAKGGLKWMYLVPFFFTMLIIPIAVKFTALSRLQIFREDPGISSMNYFLTQCRVMVTYIRLAFLPLNQNLDYDYPVFKSFFATPVWASFLFLAVIFIIAKQLFLKHRLVSFSIFWFFLTLLPESSLFPIKDVIFEHRLYLPLVGYSIFLVSGMYYGIGLLCRHSEQSEESKGILRSFTSLGITMVITMVIITMVVACYSILTYQRNKVWRDEFALWNDTVGKSPHKARPYNNRGFSYLIHGNFDQAMLDFNKAIALDPNTAMAYINRGAIYEAQGKIFKALVQYTEACMIMPKLGIAYHNRAVIYNKLGQLSEAISNATKVIEIDPSDPNGYITRSVLYSKQGDFNRAISDINKALEIDPNNKEAYSDRVIVYSLLKKHEVILRK